MPNDTLDLRSLEKVDLHRHLEGSIRLGTALELGKEVGAFPADLTEAELAEKAVISEQVGLLEALDRFDLLRRPIKGYDAVVRIARECVDDAANDGVVCVDVRFSPSTLAKSAGIERSDVFRAVREGSRLAQADHPGVAVELVVIISRRRGLDAAWGLVRDLEEGSAELIEGVDFASDELRHRTAEFSDVAAALHGLGLPLTVHTGEGVDASAIAEALALPGVRRLGHALSLIDDAGLVREVIDRQITVESCPTSNVRTTTVESLSDHPAHALVEAGVRLVLCTDDPALFAIDLTSELEQARAQLGFTDEELARSQEWAREAFFLEPLP